MLRLRAASFDQLQNDVFKLRGLVSQYLEWKSGGVVEKIQRGFQWQRFFGHPVTLLKHQPDTVNGLIHQAAIVDGVHRDDRFTDNRFLVELDINRP